MRLASRDVEGALEFVADAHQVEAPQPLTTALLDRLTELIGCTYATYEELNWAQRVVTAYVWCSNEGPLAVPPPYVPEGFWTGDDSCYRHVLQRYGAPFVKLSDRLDRREREWIRDEEEFNAEFGIVDRLGFRVGKTRTRDAWLTFDSQERDFDERDRKLAFALIPQVAALWRRAVSRTREVELLRVLERGDAAQSAIVVYGPDGRINLRTAEARRLLAAWFGMRDGHLPHELDEWVALARPGDRYTARRNGSMLTVETAGDFILTFSEQSSEFAQLTPREREVLGLVAEGLTNAEIAERLWVVPSTVAKHLERAYSKLGVRTRTAAVARLASGRTAAPKL